MKLTLREYSPSLSHLSDRPLVAGKDRNIYPHNSTNQYISRYSHGFDGYLGCGFTAHLFRSCPRKEESVTFFGRNFRFIFLLLGRDSAALLNA